MPLDYTGVEHADRGGSACRLAILEHEARGKRGRANCMPRRRREAGRSLAGQAFLVHRIQRRQRR